jgi:hypothetical protein
MAKERRLKKGQDRSERLPRQARAGIEDAASQDKALDVAIMRNIKLRGA